MPDINTLPGASTHTRDPSRRASANAMPPPPPPVAVPVPSSPSFNVFPSNRTAVNSGQIPSPLPSPSLHQSILAATPPTSAESTLGPGPLRHPRPMTAAELHQQFEREQESVVNRLARELSLLRAAHNASVVSTTSSTSAGPIQDALPDTHILSGPNYAFPTPRHNRTSSNASARSQTAVAHLSSSPAEARRPRNLSRQNSVSRRSQTGSPGPSGGGASHADGSLNYLHQQRVPHSAAGSSVAATPGSGAGYADQMSPGLLPATARYEETAFYRAELEVAKRENEGLKRRIRELERSLRERRASDAGRSRSESVSTTTSVSVSGRGAGVGIAGPREGRPTERDRGFSVTGSVGVGVPEEEVKVGESAASAGLH
ncbi:uncharacterized protein DNG_08147 [Cephalotrichum gorgonifer]|uniref:Uncharacterized protein n=1 Tax=Cephalotrichum gorgonifer TaxID=2041049 RepID=A0AAE8SY28_9PEZI|nr:uncharacterized protein DNG_08147 [Cephalotrichum gorgonifer]